MEHKSHKKCFSVENTSEHVHGLSESLLYVANYMLYNTL